MTGCLRFSHERLCRSGGCQRFAGGSIFEKTQGLPLGKGLRVYRA